MSNSSIWPIAKTLWGATILGQSRPGSNGNEGVLHIPQISKAGAMPSDGLMSYPEHLLTGGESYPTAEIQSVYSTASAASRICSRQHIAFLSSSYLVFFFMCFVNILVYSIKKCHSSIPLSPPKISTSQCIK